MRRILGATDLSRRAELAVDRAAVLARRFDADLRLLHVVDDDHPLDLVEVGTERARYSTLAWPRSKAPRYALKLK